MVELDILTGLSLSGIDIRELTGWSDSMIEDYLASNRDLTSVILAFNQEVLEINARIDVVEADIVAIQARLTYLEGTLIVTAVDVTAVGNQTIICNAALSVTLAAAPLDKDVVRVKATNGNVIINGNGKTIDEAATLTIRRDFTGIDMVYSSTSSGWFII